MLTISDHLEWDDANEHLLILQDKLNAYLNAIESGNLYEMYPQAKGRCTCIRVVSKFEPNSVGYIFLERVKTVIEEAAYKFEFTVYHGQ